MWTVPDAEYFNCVVRITDIDNVNQMDVSDNTFNISRLKWIFQTDGEIYSPPAIGDDGTIYTISYDKEYEGKYDKYLYAINPDGTLKWKYSLGSCPPASLTSPVISDDGTLYVGNSYPYTYGLLHAINPDGTLKWKYQTVNDNYSTPAIGNDGTVYVQIDSLYAINPDGTLMWKTLPSGVPSSYDVFSIGGNNTIYIGLNAIYPDGVLDWHYITDHAVLSPTIGSDGTLYSGLSSDNNKYIYAVNPDGTLKWIYETEYKVHSTTIGIYGKLFAGKK